MNTVYEIVINNLDQLISLLAWLFIIYLVYRLIGSYLHNSVRLKNSERQQQVEYKLRMRQLEIENKRTDLEIFKTRLEFVEKRQKYFHDQESVESFLNSPPLRSNNIKSNLNSIPEIRNQ